MRAEAPPRAGALPRMHVVTDDRVLARDGWLAAAVPVLEAGGSALALHVRGPGSAGRLLFHRASELLPHALRTGASLFVNDRVDVALVVDVAGVHLGARSLGVRVARELVGAKKWIGCSVRDVSRAHSAASEGADYVFLGTIFETRTHPELEATGLGTLRDVAGGLDGLPVIGIGGIDTRRAGAVRAAGAYGVAAIRGVWDAEEPCRAVEAYLEALTNGR